jgi:hypothetical protein
MSLWSKVATMVGDTWASRHMVALWPWPAVVVGSQHGKMMWSDYRAFSKMLTPGDFLLLRSKPYFGSNAAIPGAMKHLAVYVGPVEGRENIESHFIEEPGVVVGNHPHRMSIHERAVVHAISEGVVCEDLAAPLMHADYCIAVRPWKTESERTIIIKDALAHVGCPYDFKFNQASDEEVFCTELGLWACRAAAVIEPESSLIRTSLFGRKAKVALADNFVVRFTPVCCSRSCLDSEFQMESIAGAILSERVMAAWRARDIA